MEVSGQLQAQVALPPEKKPPGTHWIGGWVGPRVGLDAVEKNGRYSDGLDGPGSILGGVMRSLNLYYNVPNTVFGPRVFNIKYSPPKSRSVLLNKLCDH
jgi:hypothetical protein